MDWMGVNFRNNQTNKLTKKSLKFSLITNALSGGLAAHLLRDQIRKYLSFISDCKKGEETAETA